MTVVARAPSERDALLGILPAQTFEPRTVEDLANIVIETAPDAVLVPLGGCTSLGLGRPPQRYDAAIRTRGLNRIVDYAHEDQVVTAEAGVTLDELQQVLWNNKQRLAIDPPGGETMTVGGMLATNAYGPLAHGYGTLKDLIVGIEAVRADGAVVRGGGKVVKNVAGFDLPKLLVGSLGTLAIVTKATFRVHPIPEKRAAVYLRCARENVFPLVVALREAQLEPASIVASFEGSEGWRLEAGFEGFAAGVDAQIAHAQRVAAAVGVRAGDPGRRSVEYGSAGSDFAAKGTFRPDAFEAVAPAIEGSGLRVRVFPGRGVVRLLGASATFADSIPALEALRAAFAAHHGMLVIERMPATWYDAFDPWGRPPPSFPLMQALKERFDPQGRLNRGRFVGGI